MSEMNETNFLVMVIFRSWLGRGGNGVRSCDCRPEMAPGALPSSRLRVDLNAIQSQ